MGRKTVGFSEGVYTEDRFDVGFDDLGGGTWESLGQRMHAALGHRAADIS